MSVLPAEVYEVFHSLDVPDGKAWNAAVVLSNALGKVEEETVKAVSKRETGINTTARSDVQSLETGIVNVKWMLKFASAIDAAMLFGCFAQ